MNPNENVWLKRSVARESVCVWGLRMDGSSKSTRNVVCAAKSNQSVSNADGTWRIERITFLSYLFFLVVRLQRWCMSFKYSWIISLPCDLDWPNKCIGRKCSKFSPTSSTHWIHVFIIAPYWFTQQSCILLLLLFVIAVKPTCQRLRFIGDMRVYVVRYW